MRRTTLLWLVLAAVCGGVLFHTSQQVTDGRTRLAVLDADIAKENETIRVLQAEWSYLNQPDRLEKLAHQYLDLGPLKGRQFTKVGDLANRAENAVATAAPSKDATPKEDAQKTASAPAATTAAAKPEAAPAPKVATAPSAAAPIIKIRAPYQPPAVHRTEPVTAQRSFGDVLKNLGVRP